MEVQHGVWVEIAAKDILLATSISERDYVILHSPDGGGLHIEFQPAHVEVLEDLIEKLKAKRENIRNRQLGVEG